MTSTAQLDHSLGVAAGSHQYLTFALAGEEYGIDILRVQEIKGVSKIRPIPNAPAYVKGVMNLRGTVVPIIDLRMRFDIAATEHNQFSVIIVVSIDDRIVGLLVDAVSDVLNIDPNEVDDAPEVGGQVDTSYFRGMGKVGDKLVLLLNLERIFSRSRHDDAVAAAN